MAIRWFWKEKCGELTFTQERDEKTYEYTLSLYEGNAFLIMLHEYKNEEDEEMYNMWGFWADKDHAKRCLGLAKDECNIYNDGMCTFKKIRLNKAKSRNWKSIVTMLAQAFDEITIELYTDKEGVE